MAEVKVTDLPAITLDSFTNNDSFLIIDDGAVRRLTRAVFYEWLAGNVQGQRGEQGVAGRDGVRGTNGLNGTNGTNGISAYQVAVQNGFVGSAEAWLASMKGDAGAKGLDGGDGWSPVFKTEDYQGGSYLKIVDWVGGTGEKPVTLGYVSNEGIVSTVAVATNLKGDIGLTGAKGETGEKGEKGDKGDRGFDGATGTNAYYLAVESGFVGTQEQWLLSLNPSEVSKDPNNIISKKLDGMYASVDPVATATAIDAIVDRNFLTDSERAKLEALKTSKYLGTFLTPEEIPTVGATAGNYADVDSGLESVDTERWIYDVEAQKFVKAVSVPASETAESVKEKYESNEDTNAFTDAEKTKLEGVTEETSETIKTKYESNSDTNAFTDAEKTKLTGLPDEIIVETEATIKTKYEANEDTNAFTDAEKAKLTSLSVDVLNENGSTALKFWTGTQEEYDLVTDKDPETVYMIKHIEVSP